MSSSVTADAKLIDEPYGGFTTTEVEVPYRRVYRNVRAEWADIGAEWTGVTPLDSSADWLIDAFRSLAKMAKLQSNWDTYGAEPPNEIALGNARMTLSALSDADFEPSRIDPSAEGGVCLSFSFGQRYGDIECFNNGEVLAAVSDSSSRPLVWEVNAAGMRAALERIRAYLHA